MDCATRVMVERVIHGPDDIREGAEWLCRTEPRFAAVYPALAPLPLRRTPDGFVELLRAILAQQVSVASARAIMGRLEAAGMIVPAQVTAATEADLRGLGLSRQKARYARALAGAGIDYAALRRRSTAEVVETLTAIPGIGVWTAEIYAMFALGRADVFAPGDLALQEGVRLLFDLPDRPKERALREMAGDWSPWRAVAARLIWAYYARAKDRQGVIG